MRREGLFTLLEALQSAFFVPQIVHSGPHSGSGPWATFESYARRTGWVDVRTLTMRRAQLASALG
jgi:hypothetical protein